MLNIPELFSKHEDKFLKSDDTFENNDLYAFNLLKKYRGKGSDIISGADHDVIYLNVDIELLSQWSTEDEIIALTRCGVMYNTDYDCLSMYV